MEENKQLNDIILDKNTSNGKNKKVIMVAATLGVIFIIVIMLMNTLSSNDNKNLPKAVLPPKAQTKPINVVKEEPLFEDVEVIQEQPKTDDNLEHIAQKLKQESQIKEKVVVKEPKKIVKEVIEEVKPKNIEPKKVIQKVVKKVVKHISTPAYYIQVGSFSKYKPNKQFLNSITTRGYNYKFHKTTRNGKVLNKVLVGPFKDKAEAKKARIEIRNHIEAGAFLIKI